MNRLILFICFALIGTTVMQAQNGLRVGANAGLPVGDMEEISDFAIGADLAYMVGVADMLYVGPKIGYTRFFIEDIDTEFGDFEIDDPSFLPIAATGRVSLARGFFFGADLGYAVGLNDGNDGGFYYRPQVGYNFGVIGLVGSYTGISVDGGSFNSVNIGVEFGL